LGATATIEALSVYKAQLYGWRESKLTEMEGNDVQRVDAGTNKEWGKVEAY
jgi:hypothetical protein